MNSFLDQANRELFRPRGLYCVIVKYNPVPVKDQEDIHAIMSAKSSSGEPTGSRTKKIKANLRNPILATTEGEQNLPPEIAPLVFSEEDDKALQTKRRGLSWNELNEYFDKRARARYVSFLAVCMQSGFY